MSKGDFPALRMKVEGGRLIPASTFDQERLDSYRRGAIVMCKLNEQRDRVLVRKWWAIITLVLKQCKTPWKTKDEASEAIKLALGIVNLSKTVSGQFMSYPKSLTELDDPEMSEALENMISLLFHMTGVDVATLNREAANVGPIVNDDAPASSLASAETDGKPTSTSPPDTDIEHERGQVRAFAKCAFSEANRKAPSSERRGEVKAMTGDLLRQVTYERHRAALAVSEHAIALINGEISKENYIDWCVRNLKLAETFLRMSK